MSWSNIIEQEINSVSPYGFNFAGYSKDTEFYAMRNDRQFLYAYQSCPPLRAIITARSKAFNRGKLKVVNKDKEEVKGKEANNLLSLLAKPNSIQSTNQFFTQLHQYIDIFGYAVVLKVKSTGFNNVTSLWNIPNWLIQINYNDRFVIAGDLTDAIKSIDFIYGGGQNVSLDDVMFIFDEGIGSDFNYKQNIYIPDSRIKTLEYPINNLIAAYKARNTLITSKGALGILSSNVQADSMKTLQQGEKEAIQNDFKRYGITGQDYQVVITDAQLKWQAMSYPTKDLMLFEEIEDDIDRIVDAYDWERDLLSRQKGSTFTNKKEAKKYVYESAIIPESKSRLQKFSEQFLPQGQYLISDYSDLYIFQEDKAKQAQALYTLNKAMETAFNAGVITVDEWRLKLENYE